MGWMDDPVIDASAQPAWASAPEVASNGSTLDQLGRVAQMFNPILAIANAAANPRQAMSDYGNLLAGGVRGAGSIGATALYPWDKARDVYYGDRSANLSGLITGQQPQSRNDERRAAMDAALQSMGADPSSAAYGVGKLGAEVAGTAGVGGALAAPVRAAATFAPKAAPVLDAIAAGLKTSGFRTGNALPMIPNAIIRAGTGATVGGVSAGAVNLNPDDAKTGAMIGGSLPAAAALAAATGGVIRKTLGAGSVSPEVRNLAQQAQDLGINIPADRLVNSRPLNAVASSLNYVPFSGRAATEDAMNSQLNQALSRTFGQNDSNVTMALRRAESELGPKFDTFLQSNKVSVDPQFMNDLATAGTQANKELGTEGASIINNQINEILAKGANGDIDGQAAYNIKKTLDRIGQRNSPEAWYALDLKGKLMDALNRSVGSSSAAEFQQLRQQYGNMLSLQKLAKNGADGEVSAARLANLQNINNPDVQQLADIAAQFVKPREGAHGAAQRVFGAGGAGVSAGLAALGIPGALPAAIGAGTVMAGSRTANSLLNSQFMRDMLLRQAAQPQSLGALTQGAYRVLPLIPAQ